MVNKIIIGIGGNLGFCAGRAIMKLLGLGVVGVVVNNPAKAGMRAIELCSLNMEWYHAPERGGSYAHQALGAAGSRS